MVESELFGHVKGAFSGAVRDKKGRFELAHGGTIFLDEVAELPKNLQVKLLRVLENCTFMRVGGEKPVTVDVRVLSATNRDLKREVEKQRFREDLYYRLNVVPLKLPPLRERQADIPLLLAHFLEQARNRGQRALNFSPAAVDLMLALPLAGECAGIAERGALCPGRVPRRGGRAGRPAPGNQAEQYPPGPRPQAQSRRSGGGP